MMKLSNLIAAVLFVPVLAFSQNDKEALQILDRFSAKALGSPSVSMKFDIVTVDQAEGTSSTNSGSIVLSGDKYRLELPDNIVWFNGETAWNYLPAEKEVTITRPGKKADSFQTRPSSVFSIYKNGYKSRLIEKTESSCLIDLYPEEIDSDHIRIRIAVGLQRLDLKSLEYKYKNGITVTVSVKEYLLDRKPEPSQFAFSPSVYPGAEVIDMR